MGYSVYTPTPKFKLLDEVASTRHEGRLYVLEISVGFHCECCLGGVPQVEYRCSESQHDYEEGGVWIDERSLGLVKESLCDTT